MDEGVAARDLFDDPLRIGVGIGVDDDFVPLKLGVGARGAAGGGALGSIAPLAVSVWSKSSIQPGLTLSEQ